ncbi:G2/M phase-specific E3 ubiquitin-protein ligase-like isoform X3 [Sander lucioperca]|uniref:G2/M phase-specific E3 ubiquitin-protein ligase-like isoform X3 n=1 Tax=Sander lucioperca TaxID=283035 RepID=UPI00125E8AFD|nr:G2/M phase-specific E3 ubiquitin-protein ligase-like isoform X3 [Sander lucioperca]
MLFEGQADHLIPSTSQVLVQSDLFKMAGRMIGHSFLHGGPPLTGVSPAILHVLLGGPRETATIVLEDVADIDIRETIQLLERKTSSELTEDQRAAVNQLALSWDLPVLTQANHVWLLHSLLQHAVLGRTSQQVKQLRQGLQDTMLWPLLEARPDVVPVVFPHQSMAKCSAQMVLDNIIWPGEEEKEDDNGISVAIRCKMAGYLRQFVETVTEEKLKQLVKFWVGWELPMQDMQVEVVQADHPTSSTCFHILRLPGYYTNYQEFHDHLEGCIATNDTGFGLI